MILPRASTMLGLAALLSALACGAPDGAGPIVEIAPAAPEVEPGDTVQFVAQVAGTAETADWSVIEPEGGAIDPTGSYTAPATEGTYTVLASLKAISTAETTVVRVKRSLRVDVSPTAASLAAGESLALTASVSGSVKTVTWSVAEAPAGGVVTPGGVYTAPDTAGTFTVIATSVADPSKQALARITVTPPPAPPPPAPAVAIAVAPQTASVVTGGSAQFSAVVTGTSDPRVTWSVLESGGGTVSTAGLYTAPLSAGAYTVVATSLADPSKAARGTVTVSAPAAVAPSGPQLYVSTTGNDANPGTEALPWRTIQKAMNSATAGSTVNVKAGTYRERLRVGVSGAAGSYITFQPYGFTGAPRCGGFTGIRCGGDQVVIDLAAFGNPSTDGVPFLAIENRAYVRVQGFTFQNYTVQGAMQRGVHVAGTSHHVEISHNRFLNNRNIGAYDGRNALLHFWVWPPANNVVIRGNEIGNIVSSYGEAMTTASSYVTIEDNWFHDIDNIAINIGHSVGPSSNIVVRRNLLEWVSKKRDGTLWYNKNSNAVYVNGGNTTLIEGNTVRNSGFSYSVCSEPGYPGSHDVTIRNNVSYQSYAGIMLGNWYSSTDGSQVYNIKVLNNTLYGNANGFVIRPYTSGTIAWQSNIVASTTKPLVNSVAWPVGTMDYNLYYGGVAGPDPHKITTDPQFTNAAAADFTLRSTSPARDGGDPYASTAAVGTLDFALRPRIANTRVDVGAHEAQ